MTIFILYTILYILATLGILAISALVFLRRQKNEYSSFAFFALLIGLWILLQFLAQLLHELWPGWALLALRCTIALPPFFCVLFYIFTRQYAHKKVAIYKHLVVPALLAIASLVPGLMIQNASIDFSGIILENGPLYYPLVAFSAAYASLGIKTLVGDMRHSPLHSARRYRTRLLLHGMLQALFIVLATIIFVPDALLSQLATPVASLIMVLVFMYAIVRHKLFDIRLVVARALAYLLSLSTFAVIYTFLAFGVAASLLNYDVSSVAQQATYIILAALLALTFAPLKRLFDRLTDRFFFRHDYDPQLTLNKLGDVTVDEIDLQQVSVKSMKILAAALKPEFMHIYIPSTEHSSIPHRYKVGSMPHRLAQEDEEALLGEIGKIRDEIIVTDLLEDGQNKLHQILNDLNISLIVRLETSRELVGYLFFGPKQNGSMYNTKDLQMLTTVGDELALAVQNSLRFQEIRDFNQTLQAKVDAATAELRRTNAKLQQLDAAKDEFISMASHQLRTPLTTVKGYLSMVLDGDAGNIKPMQRKLLDEAYASSQRMVGLISDFLNVSRLKTGKFVLEPASVSLPAIITEEIEQLRTTAAARELKINYTPPAHFPILKLDENKIRQVIMNFIDNAIFYSRAGGTIDVELLHTNKEVVCKVRDQGIGVPAAERPHLFTKFFRASNARKARPDGTGIGLFMARKVVVAHGGSIIFESVEGKGSTFGFRLPLSS